MRGFLRWVLVVAVATTGAAYPAAADAETVTASGGAIVFHDLAVSTPYPSTITVAGVIGPVTNVNMAVNGYFGDGQAKDYDFLLVGPAGQHMLPISDAGSGFPGGVNLILTDAAGSFLPQNATLASGTFLPTDYEADLDFNAPAPTGPHAKVLSVFNGTNPNGAWKLFTLDDLFMFSNSGSVSSWSLTITTDSTGPGITGAAAVPPKFAVNAAGLSETPLASPAKKKKAKKGPKGTTINYTSSEAGSVRFLVERQRGCKKAKPKKPAAAKKKKKCPTGFQSLGSFKATATVGANARPFSGVLGGKKLTPGSYRMTLTGTDAAGNVGAPAQLSFQIVK